ncbi:MAG TPA: GntR family transcriptional regulator [Bryobacteraceae bacterium]
MSTIADRSILTAGSRVETLGRSVYESIRERILSGQYPLGSPLSRRRLAEEFATSLVPVAEALQRLEMEGLVESQPRVGTRVRTPTAAEVRGSYAVREALESQSARLFCETASEKDKKILMRMAKRLDVLATGRDRHAGDRAAILEFDRAHLAFHMRIPESCGCKELVDAVKQSRILLFNWLFGVSAQLPPLPPNWHGQLAEALNSGEVLAADEAMRKHVRYRFGEIMERVSARGEAANRIARGPHRK